VENYPEGRCRVLLAADEAIQALALQYELEDAGYGVAGPFATCADGMAWLAVEMPDVAVLDTLLKDGS
jgi:DNA-binding NtrC family response regulator